MAGLAWGLFLPLLRYSNALVLMLLGGIVLGVLFPQPVVASGAADRSQ